MPMQTMGECVNTSLFATVPVYTVPSPFTGKNFLFLSDNDALLLVHCDANLPMHTMGECVSASTTVTQHNTLSTVVY
jgi:hypothetical protein